VHTDDVPVAVIDRLDGICGALPDAYQEEAWRGIRWRVRLRTFAHVLLVDEGWPPAYCAVVGSPGPHVVLTFRAPLDELMAMVASDDRFFRARWGRDVGGLVLDEHVDWEEVRELLTESFCRLAPRKLSALVDRPAGPGH
jgi:hypothetical protein